MLDSIRTLKRSIWSEKTTDPATKNRSKCALMCAAWQQAPKACSIICTIWFHTFICCCLCVALSDRAALFHWCAHDFNNIAVFLFGVQHLENVSIWGISPSRCAKLSHGSFCCCLDAVPRSKCHHHAWDNDIREQGKPCRLVCCAPLYNNVL